MLSKKCCHFKAIWPVFVLPLWGITNFNPWLLPRHWDLEDSAHGCKRCRNSMRRIVVVMWCRHNLQWFASKFYCPNTTKQSEAWLQWINKSPDSQRYLLDISCICKCSMLPTGPAFISRSKCPLPWARFCGESRPICAYDNSTPDRVVVSIILAIIPSFHHSSNPNSWRCLARWNKVSRRKKHTSERSVELKLCCDTCATHCILQRDDFKMSREMMTGVLAQIESSKARTQTHVKQRSDNTFRHTNIRSIQIVHAAILNRLGNCQSWQWKQTLANKHVLQLQFNKNGFRIMKMSND